MRAFKVTEACTENEYMVGLEDSIYQLIGKQSGSFNIVAARILGFTYPDYLRYVRQNHNATLKGKQGYSYAIYKDRKDCVAVVTLLNDAWRKVETAIINKFNEAMEGQNGQSF